MESKTTNTLKEVFKEFISKQLTSIKSIDLFVITDIQVASYTCNVKRLNIQQEYKSVQIGGIGLGNLTGIMKLPNVDDIVVCAFINNSETPVVLCSLFDSISDSIDNVPIIKQNEVLISSKSNGSYIYFNENDEVTIRCSNFKIIDFDGNEKTIPVTGGNTGTLNTN